MRDDIGRSSKRFGWEVAGSFRSYVAAAEAREKMAQAEGLSHSSLAIWPVGLKVVEGQGTREANAAMGHWTALGGLLGAVLGLAFAGANAVMALVPRPLAVTAALLVAGLTIGTIGGLCAGAFAARSMERAHGSDPLLRATRYELVVDRTATRQGHSWPRAENRQRVVDLRAMAERTHRG